MGMPKSYYKDFEVKKTSGDWKSVKFQLPNTEMEGFEFLFKPPYFIIVGDWEPVIYQFHNKIQFSELYDMALQRHGNPSYDGYLASKCPSNNHNPQFWIVIEALCEKIHDIQQKITPKQEVK